MLVNHWHQITPISLLYQEKAYSLHIDTVKPLVNYLCNIGYKSLFRHKSIHSSTHTSNGFPCYMCMGSNTCYFRWYARALHPTVIIHMFPYTICVISITQQAVRSRSITFSPISPCPLLTLVTPPVWSHALYVKHLATRSAADAWSHRTVLNDTLER